MCVFHIHVHTQVYSWGANGNGELGIGSTTGQQSPKPITALDDQVITKVIKKLYTHMLYIL